MLSFNATKVASTSNVPVPVITREVLYEGAIVKTKVPADARFGSYTKGDEKVLFVQFCYNIRGGVVNIFVHTDDYTVRGKKIVASAAILKKILEDGREYLYVDLVPVVGDTQVTHRLAVMGKIDNSWGGDGHLIFKTPAPLEGFIILAPLVAQKTSR